MNVSVSDVAACRKTMKIEIPAETISKERAETVNAYMQHATLPGFRKGKAPRHVVAKRYQKEILQDIQERIVPMFYHEALQQSELKVVNVIAINEFAVKDNEPLVFEVTVDVEPEIKLPKYDGIAIKEVKEAVTDEMVEAEFQNLLNQSATFNDADEETAVAAGDMAQLKYTATIDGKSLEEIAPNAKGIGEGDGYWVSADENAFLPGMGEAIVGLKKGDTKEVEIEFGDNFVVKELNGQTAKYAIEVTAVRTRTLPEVNDAFLARFQMDSEEQLRAAISAELVAASERRALNDKHEQIIKYLVDQAELELPESVVENQTRNMLYDIAHQRLMSGLSQDQLSDHKEEIQKEAEERAIENTKLRYIGLAIAAELGFDASDVEIDEEIANLAIRQRKDATTLRKEMEENGTLSSVSEQVRFNKALDYMVEKAKVS
jgi:trigger factor